MQNEILNTVLTNATIVVRDGNLTKKLEEKYITGTIILERCFTDATYKIGGIKTPHRYSVISNQMKDLSTFEHNTLLVGAFDSHYLILKIKTQITLLYLPTNKYWEKFKNIRLEIFKDMIKDIREQFEEAYES